VDGSGGADFTGIQDAINDASDGDTIIVHSGVYYENVVVDKSVTLKGIGHPVVDAGGEGSAITLTADGITLEGFTVANSGSRWSESDAGINVNSNNNTITGNNVNNDWCGISLSSSSNNNITGNNVSNNVRGGISLWDSCSNNTITGNTFVNCGLFVFEHYQNAVGDNTVNGKPLVYLEDASDYTVEDAGQVILVNCTNITVDNLDLSNTSVGIELWKTEDSKVLNNTVSNNSNTGIILSDSSNNTITGNTISNNSNDGINLFDSSNNSIYLNNFINNTFNVDSYASTNIWNSPLEITYTYVGTTYASYLGNYWADYKGRADANGIGNTPYSIDSEKEECDFYPLTKPFEYYICSESDTEVAATTNMETIAKTFINLLKESERT
jgi:parallel beta-helix repeat protein